MKTIIRVFFAGLVTGVLIAPRKGSITRKMIRAYLKDLADAASGNSTDIGFDNESRL